MSLGKLVRQRREERKLTQDQLALQTGISKPYLSNIETGKIKNPPSDKVLVALEAALDFVPAELTRMAHVARTPLDIRQEHEMLEAEAQKLRSVVSMLLSQGSAAPGDRIDLAALEEDLKRRMSARTLPAGILVPLANTLSAGYPQRFTDLNYPSRVAEEYVRCCDLHDNQAFAVRIIGDPMQPRYKQGDIVVISPCTEAQSGDDCFVRFAKDDSTTFRRLYRDRDNAIRLQPLNSRYPSETYSSQEISGYWPAVFRIERLREA